MRKKNPGPKAQAILKQGNPYFQKGMIFEDLAQKSARRGFRPAGQVMVDRAKSDFIWVGDGIKYIEADVDAMKKVAHLI